MSANLKTRRLKSFSWRLLAVGIVSVVVIFGTLLFLLRSPSSSGVKRRSAELNTAGHETPVLNEFPDAKTPAARPKRNEPNPDSPPRRLTQAEVKILGKARERARSAYQGVERANTKIIKEYDDDKMSTVVAVITRPTREQYIDVSNQISGELNKLSGNQELQAEARKQFHAVENDFLNFESSKYKLIIPTIYPNSDSPPQFILGFSDDDDLLDPNSLVHSPPPADLPPEVKSSGPLIGAYKLSRTEFRKNWEADKDMFSRYSYLFEVTDR